MEKESRVPLSLWKALIMTSEQVTASIDELSVGNACFFELFYLGLNHSRAPETSYGELNYPQTPHGDPGKQGFLPVLCGFSLIQLKTKGAGR